MWLGIALVALAASAAAVFWWLRAGASRVGAAERAAMGALPLLCPACRRGYPAGTTYCPVDACKLVASAEGASAERSAQGGKCPRCRRVYDAGTRFCAVDAEELVPLPLWQASHAEGGVHVDEADATGGGAARARASPCTSTATARSVRCARPSMISKRASAVATARSWLR